MILQGIIPYLPSLRWMESREEMPSREYTRTLIDSNTPQGMVLTVPVAGGSSSVKKLPPALLEISSHGDWTRIHLGAIEAAYGREPYFPHFFPDIEYILKSYPESLANMNRMLLLTILSAIDFDENANDIKKFKICHPKRYENISSRLFSKIDRKHSIIEPLFRLGPDLIFLLNPQP
ncbi:MAG: WbqC family protein [Muribaculum sp.]|nr:WbqC family protein [Muribaculum sp.]